MSIKSLTKTFLLAVLTVGAICMGMPAARAQQPGAGSVPLWNDKVKDGQWRAFGNGLEDTAVLTDAQGLEIIVDWTETKWGVGAIYQHTPKTGDSAEIAFPNLSGFHKIRFEVRSEVDDHTTVLMELACTAQDKDFRPDSSLAKPLTVDWQTIEVDLAHDFPGLDSSKYPLDAVRLLFSNASKTGKNTLEFRNVTLVP
jgi:hypothetical protein